MDDRGEREAVMRTQTVGEFTPTHHALMMGWISKAVVEAVGEEEGERIIRGAVVRYGNQRGRRMAMRAEANGHPRTFADYVSYAEVKLRMADFKMEFLERSPDARGRTSRCPWSAAWAENGLMQYGRFFCMEIDKAVVQGFNEDLVLEVNSTLSDGAEYCDMTFRQADLTLKKMLGIAWKKAVRPGRTALMPWEYHVGHLYETLGEVITEELGERAGDVMAAALEDFTARYGEAATETVLAYRDTDFDQLPDPERHTSGHGGAQ
jgi:hypothetical protein